MASNLSQRSTHMNSEVPLKDVSLTKGKENIWRLESVLVSSPTHFSFHVQEQDRSIFRENTHSPEMSLCLPARPAQTTEGAERHKVPFSTFWISSFCSNAAGTFPPRACPSESPPLRDPEWFLPIPKPASTYWWGGSVPSGFHFQSSGCVNDSYPFFPSGLISKSFLLTSILGLKILSYYTYPWNVTYLATLQEQ